MLVKNSENIVTIQVKINVPLIIKLRDIVQIILWKKTIVKLLRLIMVVIVMFLEMILKVIKQSKHMDIVMEPIVNVLKGMLSKKDGLREKA